jgi:predicted  nucleic acid-binding Zn-ribbon protein
MVEFNKDIDTSNFDEFDFGFELVDSPAPVETTSEPQSVSVDTTEIDDRLDTLEDKINNVLNIVSLSDSSDDIRRAIEDQGVSISTALESVEDMKENLERDYERKLEEVEKLVLPLLVNLTKNPEREYIKWPNRAQSVQSHINKILEVTRGNGD